MNHRIAVPVRALIAGGLISASSCLWAAQEGAEGAAPGFSIVPGSTGDPMPGQSGGPAQADRTPTLAIDRQAEQFITEAARDNMAEILLGDVAQNKSPSAAVRDYASRLIQNHRVANGALRNIAAAAGVPWPGDLSPQNVRLYYQLGETSGRPFDRAFIDAMVAAHEKAIRRYEQAAGETQSEQVQGYIAYSLPLLRNHLQLARSILESEGPPAR